VRHFPRLRPDRSNQGVSERESIHVCEDEVATQSVAPNPIRGVPVLYLERLIEWPSESVGMVLRVMPKLFTNIRSASVKVSYQSEPRLECSEFIDLLRRSTLSARRPVANEQIMQGMLDHADVIVTARIEGKLVGVSRAITDFHYCTYLSDLAVDEAYQHRGIGRELVLRTHLEAGLGTTLILLAAPAAREYYPKIGMQRHESCWYFPPNPNTVH